MRRYLFLAVLIFAALGCSKDDTVSSGSAPAAGESVTVTNKANETDATVNTLSATITKTYGSDYEYQSDKVIKVKGTINSADFESLRTFVSVDLSEVEIVGDVLVEPYYIVESADGTVTENAAVIVSDGSAIPAQAFSTRDGVSSSIQKITFSDAVTLPGYQAFMDCVELLVVSGGKFASISESAFEGCSVFEGVSDVIANMTDGEIANRAFYGCNIKNLVIPATISKIGDEAFNFDQGESNLDAVNFEIVVLKGDAIPTLGSDVFPYEFARSYAEPSFRRYVLLNSTTYDFADFEPKGWSDVNLEDESGSKTDDIVISTVSAGVLYDAVAVAMGGEYAAPYSIILESGSINEDDIELVLNGVAKFDLGGVTIDDDDLNTLPDDSFAGTSASPVSVGMSLSSVASTRTESGANITLVSGVLFKNIETIGARAFQYCEKLFNVELSSSSDSGFILQTIGDNAFDGCWALTQESFQRLVANVRTIGKEAFQSCYTLTDIVIPMSVTSIGDGAFEFCDAVSSITVSWITADAIPAVTATTFPSKFLKDGGDGSAIKIPDMKGAIYADAEGWDLYNVNDGTSSDPTVVAPSAPGGLDEYMKFRFGDDYLNTTIDKVVVQGYILVDGALQSDGTYVDGENNEIQQYLANVKELDLSDAILVCDSDLNEYSSEAGDYLIIPNGTFKYNLVWERLVLPSYITQTSSQSFDMLNCSVIGCTSLQELIMPPGATAVGWEFAKDCTSLTSVGDWFETTANRIGEYSFKNTGFTELTIGGATSATTVQVLTGAFQNCANLQKVTFRDNATAYSVLGSLAFDGCTAITEFVFETVVGSLPTMWSTSIPSQFKKAATSEYIVTVPSGMESSFQAIALTDASGTVTKAGDAYCFTEADLEVGKEKDQEGYINGEEMMYCADRLYELVDKIAMEDRESIVLNGKIGDEDWAYLKTFVNVDLTDASNSSGGTFVTVPASAFVGGENDTTDTSIVNPYEDVRTVTLKLPATTTTFSGSAFARNLVIETIEVAEGTSTFTLSLAAFSLSWNTVSERAMSAATFKHIVERSTYIAGWAGVYFTKETVPEITLNEKLTYIGSSAFQNTAVTAIYCPWDNAAEFPQMAGANAFASCTFYVNKTVDIEELQAKTTSGTAEYWTSYTIEHIPDGPGYSINGADKIDVPDGGLSSVEDIDDLAAAEGSSITITGNPDIDAFDWATVGKFATVDISANENYTEIPAEMFKGAAMSEITLPSTITAIGDSAFEGCAGLTTVNQTSTSLTIGEASFSGCSSLSDESAQALIAVTTTFGDDAFNGVANLTAISFTTSVTAIGGGAFDGCSGVTSIVTTWPSETQFPTVTDTTFPSQFYTDAANSITVEYAVDVAALADAGWSSNYNVTNGEQGEADNIVYVTTVGGLNQALIYEYDADYLADTKATLKVVGYVVISETEAENEVQTYLSNVQDLDLSEAVMVTADGATYDTGSNTNIPSITFKNLTVLTKLTMPTDVTYTTTTSDPKMACGVTGCTNLTTVVTSGVSLGWEFAKNVSTLKYLGADQTASNTYIYGITKLDGYALYGTAVEQLTFGPTFATAANSAAYGCTALSSVSFDNSGTLAPSIAANAFYACDVLYTIEFKGSMLPTTLYSTSFPSQFTKAEITSNSYITVPEDQIDAYKAIVLTDTDADGNTQTMGDVYRFADDAVEEYSITEDVDADGLPTITIECWSKTPLLLLDLINKTTYASTSGPIDATLIVKGLVGVYISDSSAYGTKSSYTKFMRVEFKDAEIIWYTAYDGSTGTYPTDVTKMYGQEFSWSSNIVSASIPSNITAISWNTIRGSASITEFIINSADAESLPTVETTSLCTTSGVNTADSNRFMRGYEGEDISYVTIPQDITFEEAEAFSNWALYNLKHPDGTTHDGGSVTEPEDTTTTEPEDTTLAELHESYSLATTAAGEMEAMILANADLKNWYNSTEETSIATTLTVSGTLNATDFTALQKFTVLDLSDVTIDSSTVFPASSFKSNTVITKVTLPTSITELGASAFQSCTALTEVVMGENLKIINSSAFQSCSSMKTSLNVSSQQFTYFGGNVFNGTYVCGGAEGHWVISKEMTFLGEWCLSCWNATPRIYLQWTTAEELDAVTFAKADTTEPENFAPQKYHLDTTVSSTIYIPNGTTAIYEAKFTNLNFEEMADGASVPTTVE